MGFFKRNDTEKDILAMENEALRKRVKQLEDLCEEKDEFFLGAISDGMRHGSSTAARHMAERKQYLNGK